jgi:ElaB/YqjD/DUF883 family membrane-anchored ribosome-binding protein
MESRTEGMQKAGSFNQSTEKSVGNSISRGRDAVGAAASDAMDSAGGDFKALQNDLNNLKDTVTKFISQAGNQASKSARDITSNVAGQVGTMANDMANRASDMASRGADMASAATEQAKGFAGEVENMVRRNPLGALAGAVVLGVLIGTMGRRS